MRRVCRPRSELTSLEVTEGIDLSGVRALVTGAARGLGLETVRTLLARGASVIATVRSFDRAGELSALHGRVEIRELDLGCLSSIEQFCRDITDGHQHLHLLVANAGVMTTQQSTTADGFEIHFGTNHLGHFALVEGLTPLLLVGSPARVVVVSSLAHRNADVELDDLGFEHSVFDPRVAYARSKTANVLFAVELDRRMRHRGVRTTAVHPGVVLTDLFLSGHEHRAASLRREAEAGIRRVKTVAQGAATAVWAGVVAEPDEVGGRYCEDCSVAPVVDLGAPPGVMSYAVDPDRARSLWQISESLLAEARRRS